MWAVFSSINVSAEAGEPSASSSVTLCSLPAANIGTFFKSSSIASNGNPGRANGLDNRTLDEGFRILLLEYVRGVDEGLGACDPNVVNVGVRTKLRLSGAKECVSEKDSTAEWNDGACELAAPRLLAARPTDLRGELGRRISPKDIRRNLIPCCGKKRVFAS